MSRDDRIIVVGAGVVGLSIALRLARRGLPVTLVDPLPPGGRASYGNAGIISPVSVMPMSGPGVLHRVPRWLLDPTGPLFIAPRYFPTLMPWLLRYIRAGSANRVRRAAQAMHYLHRHCVEDLAHLLGDAFMAADTRFPGSLQFWSESGNARASALGAELRKRFGIEAEIVEGERLRDLAPGITPEIRKGMLLHGGGFTLDPVKLTAQLAHNFAAAGGEVLQRAVECIELKGTQGVSINTNLHPLSARKVIVAAGVWSGRLLRPLGVRVPLEAERGYHATLPNHNLALKTSISFKERGFSITPMRQGLRIAGTVEFAGLDAPPTMERARHLVRHASDLFPGIVHDEPLLWSAHRPSLPDSLPVIGDATGDGRVLMAFGHSHYGMSGAAGTARIVEDIVHGHVRDEHACFSHKRF